MSRILALDFGTKRVGAALSDPGRRIATPLEVFFRRSRDAEASHYRQLVKEHEIGRLVVGLPVLADGTERDSAGRARAWGERLAAAVGLPLVFFDERYTTTEAEELLRARGLKASRRRGLIDMMAALVLLEAYIDAGCPDAPASPAPLNDPTEMPPR